MPHVHALLDSSTNLQYTWYRKFRIIQKHVSNNLTSTVAGKFNAIVYCKTAKFNINRIVNVFPKKIALMRNHAIQRHCRLFNSVTDT
jgi:hypothetical protein